MLKTKLTTLLIGGLFAVMATGCIVDVEPDRATNPVGTEHTVTATLRDPEEFSEEALCNILDDVFDGLAEIEEELPPVMNPCENQGGLDSAQLDDIVEFEVISGPNIGMSSHNTGVCRPSCNELPDDREISWTYRSNGAGGTDVIRVCASEFLLAPPETFTAQELGAAQLTEEELFELLQELFLDAINEEFGTDLESVDEISCQEVTKTWQEPQRPSIGAGLSGLFQGQPTPLPTAAAPAPAAPSQVIRPPSTGDAGLR